MLVAAIITQVRDQGGFPKFGWWAVAYSFCTLVGVIVVVASASQDIYAVAVGGDSLRSRIWLIEAGRWFPGSRPQFLNLDHQQLGI